MHTIKGMNSDVKNNDKQFKGNTTLSPLETLFKIFVFLSKLIYHDSAKRKFILTTLTFLLTLMDYIEHKGLHQVHTFDLKQSWQVITTIPESKA